MTGTAKVVLTGLNGRPVAIDLVRVETIMDEGDGEVHIFTSSDWYRVKADFNDIVAQWQRV